MRRGWGGREGGCLGVQGHEHHLGQILGPVRVEVELPENRTINEGQVAFDQLPKGIRRAVVDIFVEKMSIAQHRGLMLIAARAKTEQENGSRAVTAGACHSASSGMSSYFAADGFPENFRV